MVDGSESRRLRGDDRGQLILVGAVVIAIALVGVVVVLNSVLYTENVANREPISSTRDARDAHALVREDIGSLVRRVDYEERYDSPNAVRTAVNASVAEYGTLIGLRLSRRSPASLNLTVVDETVGTGIEQDPGGNFTNATDASNWTVARNADVRRFVATVNRSSLSTDANASFAVTTTDGSANWTLSLYRNGSDVVVRTNGSSIPTASCNVTADRLRIDFRNGTASGCSFTFADGVGDGYDVTYRNGANASGNYSILLNGTDATIPSESVHTDFDASPYRTYVVYDVSVRLTYATPELTYRTLLRTVLYEP
ncbi:hypothetical protein [Haladaptatus sp. CMAA 1911]|uniref:DUF7261 family protein n=1 Tax=unclassified Haladaptatus TaxID=2622732 RepID=UPI0037545998